MRPEVLVACASDWASPARLPRVLAAAGARVVALSPAGYALTATRYVDRVVDAPAELEAYVDALRDHLDAHRYAWVIVADDPLLVALRARALRGERWLRTLLPIASDHPWSSIVASKTAFARLGAAAGLPVPASRTCHAEPDAARAADELGLPLMLKQAAGFAGLGVRLVRDRADVARAWADVAGGAEPVVAQRFVEGPVGNTTFLMERGRPIAWMSAYKARTFQGPFGPSSARRFMVHGDVAPLLARVGALTGYHGFGAVDWIHGADDRLHTIELNARPVPAIHMGPRAGVDFARAVREMLAGAATVQVPPAPPVDAPVHPMFPEDVYRLAHERALDRRAWAASADVPWGDPRLLLHHLRVFYRAVRSVT
jgi:predicted ATP-grasp superfamily ATP-dependent carboligase